jgi:hypothetical protein
LSDDPAFSFDIEGLIAGFPIYGDLFLTEAANPVIPAKAGIHEAWIPAYAGMTT